jgi:hypothetical protein
MMNIMMNGFALLGALCPALADAGMPSSLVIAVAGLQDAETSKDAPDIDPQAVAELEKMIAELARYDKIIFKTRTTREAVQDSGIKLHFEAEQEIGIHRPNKMYSIALQDDGRSRKFWFDSSSLSFLNVTDNEYIQLESSETINEMLDDMFEESDLPAPPMLDFLYSDMGASFLSGLQSAWYVGESTVRGKKCHHLAFSQEDVDFQMWIPTTGRALPVKYTITWTNEPHMPSFTARFTEWNTAPSFAKDAFSFAKPTGATEIELPKPSSERD